MALQLLRGQVYFALPPHLDERKPYLIVSNNQRNKALGDALAVRITTTEPPVLDSTVRLLAGEPIVGWVLCDDIQLLLLEDIKQAAKGLSAPAMQRVDDALRAALGLPY